MTSGMGGVEAARDIIGGLQDILRRLDKVKQREQLIDCAVLEDIWYNGW